MAVIKMKLPILPLAFTLFLALEGKCHKLAEFRNTPTELAFRNFEAQNGLGTYRARYDLLLSFRPSTQDSGLVTSGGSGLAGGYGHRYLNRLYTAYTVGIYHKVYFDKAMSLFWETDIFYRNWDFDKKPAEFNAKEKEKYSFKVVRSEHVDVFGLKLLFGTAVRIRAKKERKYQPFLDLYMGAGLRLPGGDL